MNGLFITGTDTGIGKTYVACSIIRAAVTQGLRIGAYKPVCSGAEIVDGRPRWEDVEALAAALQDDLPPERICPQRFLAPLAPPAAAAAEGRRVDEPLLADGVDWWRDQVDLLVVEGVGGWLCPLAESRTIAELAAELGFPVLVVAANRLGTINHTLLTLESIRSRGLSVAGIVLNDVSMRSDLSVATNAADLWERADVPWLATLGHGRDELVTRDGMASAVDWNFLTQQRAE